MQAPGTARHPDEPNRPAARPSPPASPPAHQTAVDFLYGELRVIAAACMRMERPGPTLQPTAVVNEALARLLSQSDLKYCDADHFRALAAMMIRRILVDHARQQKALKRGGGAPRIQVEPAYLDGAGNEHHSHFSAGIETLWLDDALNKLGELNKRHADIAEMKLFGSMTDQAIAHRLDLSRKTISRDWIMARAWLSRELYGGPAGE
ncbi:MAG: sigma-70 family RNA polymerase sigma factor [Planctomycetes bacterium]|nr:sigma-70 family RNA polymerase sigma factor [Planctomycetota bacterium]